MQTQLLETCDVRKHDWEKAPRIILCFNSRGFLTTCIIYLIQYNYIDGDSNDKPTAIRSRSPCKNRKCLQHTICPNTHTKKHAGSQCWTTLASILLSNVSILFSNSIEISVLLSNISILLSNISILLSNIGFQPSTAWSHCRWFVVWVSFHIVILPMQMLNGDSRIPWGSDTNGNTPLHHTASWPSQAVGLVGPWPYQYFATVMIFILNFYKRELLVLPVEIRAKSLVKLLLFVQTRQIFLFRQIK